MVDVCSVPECKSGYRSDKDSEKIAVFKFLRDTESINKWLKSILSANWTLGESDRACTKHFSEDFIRTSFDKTNVRRHS